MELIKLESTKTGDILEGIIYRNENKDWIFRNYTERYGWQDTYLTYFKPVGAKSKTTKKSSNEVLPF